jgi:prevent-host-death family protein
MEQRHMQEIGAFEAKNTLGTLLDRVERGEEIVITRHGKPVARLVPSSGRIDREQAHAAAERIRVRAKALKLGKFDWETLKADRDDGRP